MYSPAQFGKLIGKSVKTLQRWDIDKTLVAHRNSKNRRYYTHDQYLTYIGIKADKDKVKQAIRNRTSDNAERKRLYTLLYQS